MPTLTFQTLDAKKKASPFVHGLLQLVETPPKSKKERVVFSAPLDGSGRVRIPERRKAKEGKQVVVSTRTLRLLDLDGEVLLEQAFDEEAKELPPITLDASNVVAKLKGSIGDGKAVLGVALKKGVLERLKAKKITSLAALHSGSKSLFTKLEKADKEQLEMLMAHAQLQVFSRQQATNARMIKAGITSAEMVTRFSPGEFLERVKAGDKEKEHWQGVWRSALTVMASATTTYVQGKVDAANRRPTAAAKMYLSSPNAQARSCQCGCGSAVSPLAYLADLLDFAVRNVRRNGNPVSMEVLNDAFHQPFRTLPTNCTAAETLVRQVRLCIEVLRRKAAADGVDVLSILAEHGQRTYDALLNELGVSYSELRSARTSSDARKRMLAERMGIDVADLEAFTLFPAAQNPPANRTINEANIEALFGFPMTEPDRAVPANCLLHTRRMNALSAQWKRTDDATEGPLVDPDLMDRTWFASEVGAINPWEELYLTRKEALDALHQAIRTAVVDQASLERVLVTASNTAVPGLTGTLGLGLLSTARLDALNTARKEGQGYTNTDGTLLDLAGHYLSRARLDRLLAIRELAIAAATVPADWDEVAAILVSVDKEQRLFATWKPQEQATISVDPRWLLMPQALLKYAPPAGATAAFLAWRFAIPRRRALLDTLSTRVEQRDALTAALSALVDKVEETVLEKLRDELLLKVVINLVALNGEVDPAVQLDHVRKWTTNNLLINAYESSCRKTTRVAQATEALQLLLWGVHSGLVEDVSWKIHNGLFVNEWRWMGTYGAWRSAMWTFLYPENILMPHTRRRMSLPFAALVQAAGMSVDSKRIRIPADNDTLMELPGSERGSQAAIDSILAGFVEVAGAENGPLQQMLNARDVTYFTLNRHVYRIRLRRKLRTLIEENEGTSDDGEAQPTLSFQGDGEDTRIHFFRDERYLWLPLFAHDHAMRNGWYDLALRMLHYLVDPVSGMLRQHIRDVIDELGETGPLIMVPPQVYAGEGQVDAQTAWLQDPMDPHRLADIRPGSHERSIMLRWASCLASYAHAEFSKDTSLSLAHARELYLKAQQVLGADVLGHHGDACSSLRIRVGTEKWREIEILLDQVLVEVGEGFEPRVGDDVREQLEQEITGLMDMGRIRTGAPLREQLRGLVTTALRREPALQLVARNRASAQLRVQYVQAQQQVVGNPMYSMAMVETDEFDATYDPPENKVVGGWGSTWIITLPPSFTYCIPPNPIIGLLRLTASVGMYKLNNCMNAAGLKREVPPYSAPTDTTSGVPATVLLGTVQAPTPVSAPPTQYRYKILIERARQLHGYAQQLEATYFSYIQGLDNERFSMLQAQQGLGIAKAQVRLQDLRKVDAEHQFDLAQLQWDRVDFIRSHYEDMIEQGWTGLELAAFWFLFGGATAGSIGAIAGLVTGGAALGTALTPTGPQGTISGAAVGSAVGALAGAIATAGSGLTTWSSWFSTWASFERREEEWEFQRDLAKLHDLVIADQQKVIAQAQINVVDQEWRIASLSADNATDVVEFLDNKFTNRELYAWMIGVVGGVYRYMLQQSCSMAMIAQRQLAFERQEPERGYILADYWDYADASGAASPTDRRGMTGAERLLQDLTKLDEYAFIKEERKLNLSKTISLARMGPLEFQRFRETGVLPINLQEEYFDRDFPGHYLRRVKRIRVSVIALIPPAEGIRASLTSSGVSKLVRNGTSFEEVTIRNTPEMVALTAPVGATGVFELHEQPEMLLPFEGMGVAGSWIFEMPRAANPIDYGTIADVLFTIEYTALPSDQYKRQLVQVMNQDRTVEGDRLFSFRTRFADAWYDLNHPELLAPGAQMKVSVDIRRTDFPHNVLADSLRTKHITLFIARKDGSTLEVKVKNLVLKDSAGVSVANGRSLDTVNGLLSTRVGPGTDWLSSSGGVISFGQKSPVGSWSFEVDGIAGAGPIADAFKNSEITDILLVITYSGETPPWPV